MFEKKIRKIVNNFQIKYAYKPPKKFNGSVLDGRDITSVIMKNAMFKFFITADIKTRALRRFKELKSIKDKYNELINNSSGKVIKVEEWGLLNLAYKIKNYKKGFYIHFKFEGNNNTLNEIEKKIKVDGSIIRYLTVKYKKLDTKNEFFKKREK